MSLSCRFLQIKEVIKSSRKCRLFGSKLDIFVQKKIYDADTKSLIFFKVISGCPILQYVVLHQTILIIVYYWCRLLQTVETYLYSQYIFILLLL